MNHTPGPWRAVFSGKLGIFHVESEARISEKGVVYGVREGNAHLLAAAPDMLAVLEELRDSASYWSEYDVPLGIVERIEDAIKKARGEERGWTSKEF